jgi:hypothetical protein
MLLNPQRAQANLDEALRKIRQTQRTRFGIVGGVVVAGLIRAALGERPLLESAPPILALAVAGAVIVQLLTVRERKRAEREIEKQTFHVPKRKTRA